MLALVLSGSVAGGPSAGADRSVASDALIEAIPPALNLEYQSDRSRRELRSHWGVLWMAGAVSVSELQGRWVHSHEEGSGERLVFRPPSFQFPPSRGRTALNLMADGTVQVAGPGADDRGATSAGRWSLQGGDQLTIAAPGWSGKFQVESVDEQRLVLRRLP